MAMLDRLGLAPRDSPIIRAANPDWSSEPPAAGNGIFRCSDGRPNLAHSACLAVYSSSIPAKIVNAGLTQARIIKPAWTTTRGEHGGPNGAIANSSARE